MTTREELELLAQIDRMVALRDLALRRDNRRCHYITELMQSSISLLRERLREERLVRVGVG